MRTLAVALLLSLPLTAGDRSPLEKAVELFKSPDAAKRSAGSQLADRELRKLLAPLLKAMEDDDPEVRRRARRSILSLVPGEAEKNEKQQTVQQNRALVIQGLRGARLLVQQRVAGQLMIRGQLVQVRDAESVRAKKLLRGFGIETGHVPRFAVNGRRTASAHCVLKVAPASRAARLGLRVGDLIVRINGKPVPDDRKLLAALGAKPDWDRITVSVRRDGKLVRLPKK